MGIPPNRAVLTIKAPTISASDLYGNLITAQQLSPIDWRKKANLVYVKNQHNCGDCWAQSSCSALSDRFIIQKNIQNLDIDPVLITQCSPGNTNQGCNGNSPYEAGLFLSSHGGVDSSDTNGACFDWKDVCQNGNCTNLPLCSDLLNSCGNAKLYKATPNIESTTVISNGSSPLDVDEAATIINMKKHLSDGPYPVCFFVPNDFYGPSIGYKWEKTNGVFINGFYNDDLDRLASQSLKNSLGISDKSQWGDIMFENGNPAGHAVELVGWGIENAGPGREKTPCWYVKNSWSPNWNEDGYFRIAMNDFSTTGKRYNQYLGLDIPVSTVVRASNGQTILTEGSLFGGGTVISPDLSTGGKKGQVLPIKEEPKNKSRLLLFLLIVFFVIFLIFIVYRLLKKRS